MDLPTFNERNLGQILHHNEIAGQAALLHQVAAHFFLAQLCIKDAVIPPLDFHGDQAPRCAGGKMPVHLVNIVQEHPKAADLLLDTPLNFDAGAQDEIIAANALYLPGILGMT